MCTQEKRESQQRGKITKSSPSIPVCLDSSAAGVQMGGSGPKDTQGELVPRSSRSFMSARSTWSYSGVGGYPEVLEEGGVVHRKLKKGWGFGEDGVMIGRFK